MSYLIAAIDESARPKAYLMCATVASTSDRHHIRQIMRGMLLPNQRRLHAYGEREGRKRMVIKAVSELSCVGCHLVVGPSRDERHRSECIRKLTDHLIRIGVAEVVIERMDDGNIRRDAQVMADIAVQHRRSFAWRHEAPDREPMLWISDFVLWAYGAGGEMRRLAEPIISTIHTLDG